MDNEGLMIFIFQAIIALFAFFVVAPCVLNAVSLFTVQKRFAKTMIDLGVVKEDVVKKLHPKKEIAGVIISLVVVAKVTTNRSSFFRMVRLPPPPGYGPPLQPRRSLPLY